MSWPSQMPDLNSIQYNIWSVLEEEVQGSSHPNMESLKVRIVQVWEEMKSSYVIKIWVVIPVVT